MIIRKGRKEDIQFFIKIKESINSSSLDEFIMGLSVSQYRYLISEEFVYVLVDDSKDNKVVGFAIGISNDNLDKTPLNGTVFKSIPLVDSCYFSTLAILPNTRYRLHAASLALTLTLDLLNKNKRVFLLSLLSPYENSAPFSLFKPFGFKELGVFKDNHFQYGNVESKLHALDKKEFLIGLEKHKNIIRKIGQMNPDIKIKLDTFLKT